MSDHRSRDDESQPKHPPRELDEDAANQAFWDGLDDDLGQSDDPSDSEGLVHEWEVYPESLGAGVS
jgi:hypothetical protein